MKSGYRKLGELIQAVDIRNGDLSVTHLLGVSIEKKFIPSVANTIGTDLSKYKVIHKNEFACSLMQVSRDEKLPVACLKSAEVAIMSPAYHIFKIRDEKQLLPDYLEMWFKRTEFDREASYIAVGGVRGSMPWEDFIQMELPVPTLSEQQKIVNAYNAIERRIQIKRKINEKLEETAKKMIENNIDNNAEFSIGDMCDVKGGKRLPLGTDLTQIRNSHPYIRIRDLKESVYVCLNDEILYVEDEVQKNISNYIVKTNDVILSIVGTIGLCGIIHKSLNGANLTENCVRLTNIKNIPSVYIMLFLKTSEGQKAIQLATVGAVQAKLPIKNIQNLRIKLPIESNRENLFENIKIIFSNIEKSILEIQSLQKLQQLLVSRIAEK